MKYYYKEQPLASPGFKISYRITPFNKRKASNQIYPAKKASLEDMRLFLLKTLWAEEHLFAFNNLAKQPIGTRRY